MIFVKGVGMTKMGELWDKSSYELAKEAVMEAVRDSGIKKERIEAVFVGNMLMGKLENQDHLGAFVSSILGTNVPAFRLEGACASGGLAMASAYSFLKSGMYKNCLVLGFEKMTDFGGGEISRSLMGAGSEEERLAGLTFPGLYALIAKAHMAKFGTTKEQMAAVAVKNHFHASLNSKSHFPFEITIEKVLKSSLVTDPINLLDASPVTDGAAAVVLSSVGNKTDIKITGVGIASDALDLSQRESLTELKATRLAAKTALLMSGIEIKDVDLVEVHDCFTIAEILAMEDLGFCKKGDGGRFIEEHNTRLGSNLPVNTSGGLKACGHPVGATGVKQIVELTEQLRGISGKRQVQNAKIGLSQNVGGTGATVVVHVLQR